MSPLELKITSSSDPSGVQKMAHALDGFAGRVLGLNGALEGLRAHLAGLVIGAGLIQQLNASLAAARESALAWAGLRTVLASTGKASAELERELAAQADALQKLTGYSDDQVLAVQRLLFSYRGTAEQVKEVTPLVLDMATALGVDSVTAARLLGRALDGESVSMGRLNITATDFVGISAQLRQAFGGQAAAAQQAKGAAGEYRVALEEMHRAIGQLIAPTVSQGIRAAAVGLNAIRGIAESPGATGWIDHLKSLFIGGALAGGFLLAAGAVQTMGAEMAAFVAIVRGSNLATGLAMMFTSAQQAALAFKLELVALVAVSWTLVEAWKAFAAQQDLRNARSNSDAPATALREQLDAELRLLEQKGGAVAEKALQLRAVLDSAFGATKAVSLGGPSAGAFGGPAGGTVTESDPEARAAPAASFGKLREPLLRLTAVWRAFGVSPGGNGGYGVTAPERAFAQRPLGATSVFNFYEPDYQQP